MSPPPNGAPVSKTILYMMLIPEHASGRALNISLNIVFTSKGVYI